MNFRLAVPALALFFAAAPATASALEGDWEVGGNFDFAIFPKIDAAGVGGRTFVNYTVCDGLSIAAGFDAYGITAANQPVSGGTSDITFGLYNLHAGVSYALDVLTWVPSGALRLNAVFSENDHWKWHRGGNGFGLEADILLQYRGIRHLALGVSVGYHLLFTSPDFITVGFTASWVSGDF